MPLTGSGTLSINDIAGEFGGRSDPESLNEFYRGGSRVPDNNTNSAIPTSSTIAISNFYNASAAPVQLGSFSYTADSRPQGGGKTITDYYGVGEVTQSNNVNLSNNFGTWNDANFDVANSNPMTDVTFAIAQITGNFGGWCYLANVSLSGLAGKTIVDPSGATGGIASTINSNPNGGVGGGVSGRPNNTRKYGFNGAVGGGIQTGVTTTSIIQA